MQRLWAALSATFVALLTVVAFAPPATADAAVASTVQYRTIPGHDGVGIRAMVITPTNAEGPYPLLVMPSAWGTNNLLYVGAGRKLAQESGYQVISYTSRGFWDSGGQIEVAGPEDIADARKVIDWGLENTDADPDRIGMAGISYGSGISMLTAAQDDRIKAVGAMSGWTDLESSLYPNETISFQAVEVLLGLGKLAGRPGATLREVEREYRRGNIQPALDMAQARSVLDRADALNANGTAVMIAHAWNDGIFPPAQQTELFDRLTGAKRMMISPGDHATPEAFGAAGLPNETWESLTRWMDHHLKGVDNGIDAEAPVQLKPNNGRGPWTGYPDWESASPDATTLYLGKPSASWTRWQATGGLEDEPQTDWTYGIRAGVGTTARSGTLLVSGALQQFADIPTGVRLPLVDRSRAGVWTGPAYPDGVRVSGAPHARFTVAPTARDQSLFVYLYAIDRHGRGALLTHKPYTVRGAEPGTPVTVDVDLEPVVWDVPAGHRLALVVDTADRRYTSESRVGQRVVFSSPEDSPSSLTVPTA
ncbi:putative acyl esterase [Nocardiopsis mwathae]|uniref:Putative acyl esterase n=1 Tax=Nocardiopsis mwathae TaxID=1472723 RepID=A0A7W9YIU2_9ACTN|nr:CocE/NonD family hydrolase [Nocardiopsis mwathae]MBB6172974.1 putative acyl esterase [Nocardiopsis mwathae]